MKYVVSSARKNRAIFLRKQGKSYNEISQELNIAKSTLSGWLSGVGFSEEVKKERLSQAKAVWASNIREYNRRRRELFLETSRREIEQAAQSVPRIKRQVLFFLFMGIFWGEGSKNESRITRVTNSDPQVIQLTIWFLREHCKVSQNDIHGAVHLHPNCNVQESIKYWSSITGIETDRIRSQVVLSPYSKGIRSKKSLPYGTFHVFVRDARLTRQVKGWLEGVRKQIRMPE